MERQASLIVKWLHVGFIHGVMNTDNMALSGETIDFGPCAFMDAYDPATVFSSIDQGGRYAYGNQPYRTVESARFVETLPLHEDQEKATSLRKKDHLAQRYSAATGSRSGKTGCLLKKRFCSDGLLTLCTRAMDYTNTFHDLPLETPADAPLFRTQRLWNGTSAGRTTMATSIHGSVPHAHPGQQPRVIPRNHRVEEALDAAVERGNFTVMAQLLAVLSRPYDDLPENAGYRLPPEPTELCYQTFCGT
jgi:uncharacterized protein YdiU (UPF0061 family)